MKKLFSLLCVALLAMTAWGADVTFDFSTNVWNLPTTKTVDAAKYTDGTDTIIVAGSTGNGYYWHNDYKLFMGKKDAYLTLPAFDQPVEMIKVTGTSSASASVKQNIFVNGTAVSTETVGMKDTTQVYVINEDYRDAGNVYTLKVTSAHNTQITKIEVFYEPDVAAPVFNPNGGEFTVNSLAVTVSCPTTNASIMLFKVVDGEDVYQDYFFQSGEFYVTETSTYRAYAYKGDEMSEYTTVTFTKVLPTCATPTFNPASGATFPQGEMLSVVISSETEGATITYTVNDDIFEGTTPVTVPVDETCTITAIASKDGYNDSEEATATYTMLLPYTVGGTATFDAKTDTIANGSTAGWHTITKDGVTMKFYGTLSNYTDTVNNVRYDEFRIHKNQSIQFTTAAGNIRKIEFTCDEVNDVSKYGIAGFGNEPGLTVSQDGYEGVWEGNTRDITFTTDVHQVRASQIVVTLDDEIPAIVVADPVLAPENNTKFVNSQEVTITCETPGATIYYSTDGENYAEYTAPFTITETTTVKAYAELENVQSNTVTAKYIKLTEVSTIAEANALNNKTDFIFYGNVVVVYQNGSNLWVKDDTGYGLIYGNKVPTGIQDGATLKEEWTAQYTKYNGAINEYQYPENVVVDEEEELVTIVPTEYTADQITTGVINERVILKNLTLTDGSGKYMYYIYNENDTLVIYNNFSGVNKPTDLTKNYDVEGMVSYYGGKVQIVPIAFTEVQTQQGLRGDVNGDEVVNITDAINLINAILSGDFSSIIMDNSDVTGDGNVNITDAIQLINYISTGHWFDEATE